MDNATTRGILFKPVIRKVVRVLEDSKSAIKLCSSENGSAWTEDIKEEILKLIEDIELLIKKTHSRD
jgi:hypothetical protein